MCIVIATCMQMCIKFSVIHQNIEPINYMDYEYGINYSKR